MPHEIPPRGPRQDAADPRSVRRDVPYVMSYQVMRGYATADPAVVRPDPDDAVLFAARGRRRR